METRSNFHKRLDALHDDVLQMGIMTSQAIHNSIGALMNRDMVLAHSIIAEDQKINQQRFEIEETCIQLIATQQPAASDLRIIIAVLNIITEVERIGDYAVGIAKITLMIGDEPPLKPLVDIPRMAELASDMLRRSLDAFAKHDADAARGIGLEDDVVDDLYDHIYHELIAFMVEDPQTITRATRLMWVAHDLERSADRVTNICERVVFVTTGKMEEF